MKAVNGETSEVISPLRLLACILLVLFIAEAIIMFTLPLFFHSPLDPLENFVDSILLILISAPFLWLLIIRPLRTIAESKAAWATALLEHVVDGVIIFDDQGIVKSWNHAAEVMFGYSAPEVTGQHLNFFFFETEGNSDHFAYLYGKLDSPFENCRISHDDQGRRKDGSSFPIDISVSMVNLAGDTAFIGIIRDISKRKQAEVVLRESEKRYCSLFENMLGGYTYCKLIFEQNQPQDFIYLNVNAAFEKLTGLRDVVGKKVTEVMPDIFKSHPELLETYARVAMTGKPEKFEVYLAPIEAWLSITVYSNEEECFVAIFNNITDRKRSEEVVRESEERFRLLVEHAPDAIYIQTDSRFSYVNQASLALFGAKDEDDLLGLPIMERIHPDFQEIVRKRIETNNHARQKVPNLEEQYLRLDGTVVDVEASAVPFDFHGEHGALVFVRDITERKQAEEELQKKNAEMEQFIYTVSHDLRSPLVTVKTFLGYLEKDMAEDNREQLAQDIIFIHNAADKMKILLDELLELSRIDRVETPPVRVSFSEVVAEVLDALAGVIVERKVDIRLSDTDLMLIGDRPRLSRIWQNLIENAIKYGRNDSAPRIEIGVQQENGETVFFVKDDGIGIEPQYHSKIFGIFEKLNPKSPGAGMGLSMIQRIVEKCGGRVWAESEGSDKGSCFFFTLPHALVQS